LNTRIPHFTGLFGILLFFYFAFPADAAQEFAIEPAPTWADSIEVHDYDNPLEREADSGVFCLLYDVEINGGTKERYLHIAEKFLSAGGIEANSTLAFDFDPSYQQLVLHKVLVHRGGEILDELNPDKIRIIQQEKDLDSQIYNGAKTALLFLEDVQVGDWVEFEYTIRGRNPVESRHYYDSLQVRWPFPVQTENYRFLWPQTNHPLRAQLSQGMSKNRKLTGPYYEYYWHWENRPAQKMELFLPASTMEYAHVYFSDFQSWTDVANWASKSFEPTNCTVELYQKAMSWKNENVSDEERVVEALQFVQDDIRYLGIENGVSSHEATDPSIVFHRGYGDCKDKALLLCTILGFFDNVDATPILVSTTFAKGIELFDPTPLVFDHVIVQIAINGKTYYVDPTRSYQRGPLDRRYINRFWTGVPLEENSPGLIKIPPTDNGAPKTVLAENFDLSTNGFATLTVTHTYDGRDADLMRREMATVSRDSLDESLLEYYRKYYPAVTAPESPEYADNEELDEIQITAHYFIPKIWRPATQTNYIACDFASPGIMSRLFVPEKRERAMPLAVLFPENFIHRIDIEPHERWKIVPTDEKIQTKYLLFHSKTYLTNSQVRVVNQLSTLDDRVEPADLPEYFDAVDRIPGLLGLSMTKPISSGGTDDTPNWSILTAAIFFTVILFIAAIAIYRHRPQSVTDGSAPPEPGLQGLGGWLILLGFGLICSLVVRLGLLMQTSAAYSLHNWRALTDSTSGTYDAAIAPLLLYELFTQLTMLVFVVLLIVLFFQKRKIFPVLCIVYLALQLGITIVDHELAKGHIVSSTAVAHKPFAETFTRLAIPLCAWGLYFRRSKRVKATFQN
jgi:hypothetical protein